MKMKKTQKTKGITKRIAAIVLGSFLSLGLTVPAFAATDVKIAEGDWMSIWKPKGYQYIIPGVIETKSYNSVPKSERAPYDEYSTDTYFWTEDAIHSAEETPDSVKVYVVPVGTTIDISGLSYYRMRSLTLKNGKLDEVKGTDWNKRIERKDELVIENESGLDMEIFPEGSYVKFIGEGYYAFTGGEPNHRGFNSEWSSVLYVTNNGKAPDSNVAPTNAASVNVSIDGNKIAFSDEMGKPFVDSNYRTLIPVSAAAESVGIAVGWNDKTQEVTLTKDDTTLVFKLGSNTAIKNGNENITMTTAAIQKNGRTYLPAKYVFESFGYKVNWDATTETVLITK